MVDPRELKIEQPAPPVYGFGEYRIERDERLLKRGENIIHLPPKVIDLLLVLVESGGRVLSKDELMRRVWADSFVEETNLTHNISLLRRTLGEKQNGTKFIETIPRRGYRFVAEVRQPAADENVEIITREQTTTSIITEEELEVSESVPGVFEKPVQVPRRLLNRNAISVLFIPLLAAAVLGLGGYLWIERGKKNVASKFRQTSVKQLTNSGNVYWAALSPDGKLFAYSIGTGEGFESLWLGHVDGSRSIELRPAAEKLYRGLHFAPDGSSLFYVEGDSYSGGTLYKIPVFGGIPEKVKEKVSRFIAFSPDFKQFAFVRNDSANLKSRLIIADTFGTGEREIAARPSGLDFSAGALSWSPDGNSIAAGAINDEGSGKREIFVVSVTDGQIEPLTNLAWKDIRTLAWLRNGSGLIAVAADKGSLWFASQIWHIELPTGEARRVTSDVDTYGTVLYTSADSNSIMTVIGQHQTNIWLASSENLAAARQITFDSIGRTSGLSGLYWMPDGRIVYTAMADKSISLWMMNADGGNQRQITPSGATDQLPTMPSDARFIVFQSDRSGTFEIWRVNPDGSELQQLTRDLKVDQPHVSPDGEWIAFIGRQNGKTGLWRISTGGGEPVFLNELAHISPRFSPDGKLIAVGYKGKLGILSAEDGQLIRLFDVPRLAALSASMKWFPGGRAVTYRDWADGIWKQSLDGGAPERLPGLPNEKIYGYDWSPDGKYFAFTRGAENRDVILVRSLEIE